MKQIPQDPVFITPPEETERGPEGRSPGVVLGGVGSKNREGHVRVQIEAHARTSDPKVGILKTNLITIDF